MYADTFAELADLDPRCADGRDLIVASAEALG